MPAGLWRFSSEMSFTDLTADNPRATLQIWLHHTVDDLFNAIIMTGM